jgi:hypothetical protein
MLTKSVVTIAVMTIVGAGLAAQERPLPATPKAAVPAPQGRGEQQPPPAKAEPKPVKEPTKEPVGQPVNVRLEITITDQASPEPAKKVVTMLLADRAVGSIRSNGTQRIPSEGNYPVSINVDATPTILTDGNIRLNLGLEYQPRPSASQSDQMLTSARMSTLNERLSIIVQDGKSILISQAADPGSDRRITVELKATVVK